MKDLNMLGRDLNYTIIIDSEKSNYASTPVNGVILNWSGSERDRKLMDFSQILI